MASEISGMHHLHAPLLPIIETKLYSVEKETQDFLIKVCLNRYSWGAGKVGSEYSSWFIRLECIANRTKNGGRRLPDVKHECYGKLSVKSVLKGLCCN